MPTLSCHCLLFCLRSFLLLSLLPAMVQAEAVQSGQAQVEAVKPASTVTPTNPVAPALYQDGKHYRTLTTPVTTEHTAAAYIEVAEVFWYGCSHCYTLETIVDAWQPTLAKDVQFTRIPAFFSNKPNPWKAHAQLYYTVVHLGVVEKVHDAIFDEIQNKRRYLSSSDAMADFLNKRFNVNKKQFMQHFDGTPVTHQLIKTAAMVRDYGLAGVPAMVIDGRYVVEPRLAGSLENMPVIADFLIKKVRADRAKAPHTVAAVVPTTAPVAAES